MTSTKRTIRTRALAESPYANDRRKLKLTKKERDDLLRQQKAQRLASLYLDINNSWTYKEMAEILSREFETEISIHGVKALINTAEFDEAYNGLLPELGNDPAYIAARTAARDLISTSLRELRNMLTDTGTPAGVRLRAIEMVLKVNGLDKPPQVQSDASELATYLASKGIDLHQTNNIVVIPPEYSQALEELEVIEGVSSTPEE